MRKYNPYRNIFYYYRGPSSRRDGQMDRQIEDNTTKALINTLENSEKNLLVCFLNALKIAIKGDEKILYDLQVAGEESRPDAEIKVGNKSIYIESKIYSPMDKNQIERHIKSLPSGYLICITPRQEDKEIVNGIRSSNARFITWRDIYTLFRGWLDEIKDENSRFIVKEFSAYLEAINMAPFNGWEKRDFEALLNIEDDPKKELRWRVREKFRQYLMELRDLAKEVDIFRDLDYKVGNIDEKDYLVWGVLCKPPIEDKIHIPHFGLSINADLVDIRLQIEGKKPTENMKKYVDSKRDCFLRILRQLKGFGLNIYKRYNPTGKPRDYQHDLVMKIILGEDINHGDIECLMRKANQYDMCVINCCIYFDRYEKKLYSRLYLEESLKIMKQLEEFYKFSLGLK